MPKEKRTTGAEDGYRRRFKLRTDTYFNRRALLMIKEEYGCPYKSPNRAHRKRGKEFRRPFNGRTIGR